MILSFTVKEITIWNGNLVYVIRSVSFTIYHVDVEKTVKKTRSELRLAWTDEESVTRISF